jgi:sodium transport system permease protein
MKTSNVKLILHRELRDQLRDRRTLFMIAVLPLLLYPLMGMAYLRFAQFMQEHPTNIAVIGADALPEQPPLLSGDRFVADLFSSPEQADLLVLDVLKLAPTDETQVTSLAQRNLANGDYDAVVYFPPDFASRLAPYRARHSSEPVKPPRPELYFSSAKARSLEAYRRVTAVLDQWRAAIVQQTLVERDIPVAAATPFRLDRQDLAGTVGRRAAMWSKILPFVLIVWSLTGAFYPAVDLCAGEKERGTLETLLCSPAERREIVWGKLLTVMIFSCITSLLNLLGMTATGAVIIGRFQAPQGFASALELGAPPLGTLLWLLTALIPLSALFSALSLALATMARSSKEGQYYLMPLLLITMPLAMIPIMPTSEINLGNSLVPITGTMLLLRCLIEGDYLLALRYVVPVVVVTGACCLLAIRWAEDQFNDESVLFREGERFELGAWLVNLVRDRRDTPSLAEAFMAGVVLLLLQFFVNLIFPMPGSWSGFAVVTVVTQVALIATPVLLMTLMLTASPRKTLLLRLPTASSVVAAALLAITVHPAATALRDVVTQLYPVSPQTLAQLGALSELMENVPLWQLLLLLALTPALCEELAFRGFMLSGLRHLGHKGMAIVICSAFFGIMHGILQQSVTAFVLGLLLGYLAVQTGSLLPCIVFHGIHNSLQLMAASALTPAFLSEHPRWQAVLEPSALTPGTLVYRIPIVVASILASGLLLGWFRTLPFTPTPEESLHKALDRQATARAL